jgi:hypothetical protein
MAILQFRKPAAAGTVPLAADDWSQQELADFYRAHHLLQQNGVSIGMDRGRSDEGDPWLVFYDTASHDVFLHVARFDNQCMLVCEQLGLKLARPSVADIIPAFEDEVRQLTALRSERAANVVLHPAARIIMSISAAFLMFKLENGGQVQAKPLPVDAAASDMARKQDLSASARLHQALGRIFDITDAPAAAAAIAGAILSVELSKAGIIPGSHDDTHASPPADMGPHLDDGPHSEGRVSGDPHGQADLAVPVAHSEPSLPVVKQAALDLSAELQITIDTPPAAPEATASRSQGHMTPASHAEGTEAPQHLPATGSGPDIAPGAEAQVAEPQVAEPAVAAAPSPAPQQEAAAPVSLAARAVQTLLADQVAPTLSPTLLPAEADNAAGQGVGDITISSLAELDETVALFRETTLTGEQLTDTIIDFITRFGAYDVEFADGRVLIEQQDTASLSADLVGIWTNVMEDGSAISVVGHIDLVTDVTTNLS